MKIKRISIVAIIILVSTSMSACTNNNDNINIQSQEESSLKEEIKQLEESDFCVSDATNTIVLDSPYDDFVFDKPEIPRDNNYVGEVYAGKFIYKVYCHEYEDLDIYTANYNYNLKDRTFDAYYIEQITLKNSTFKMPRGIFIGSSM